MRRRNFLRLGSGEAIGGALAACASDIVPAPAPTVVGWNQLALQALGSQPGVTAAISAAAPTAARALALLHTCMYNAWAAYDDDARQTMHGVAVRLPRAERSAASKAGAIGHAARLVLGTLFPSRTAWFDAGMAGLDLGLGHDGAADPFSPAGIGRVQALGLLDAWRHDGALPFALAPGQCMGIAGGDIPADIDRTALALRWCRLAHAVSARDAHDDDRDVLLYFVLSNALADVELAGADGGAAAAEVLRRLTGSDDAGSGNGAAGFSGIAARDGHARAHAHASEALAMGRQVGAQVFEKARRYWQGKL